MTKATTKFYPNCKCNVDNNNKDYKEDVLFTIVLI